MAGLRERKKAKTRAAIARAAAEIARFEGPEMQNIGAISERADISPRTFHNYFSSREEALHEFTAQTVTELVDSISGTTATTVAGAVEEAVILGLKRGDDELTSFYSLNVLTQEMGHSFPAPLEREQDVHRTVLRAFHEIFPEIGLFDLSAQLASAAAIAQFALMYFYTYAHGEDGENIVRRAFDQQRGNFVTVPQQLLSELRCERDWVN